jgi:hypothetical protein
MRYKLMEDQHDGESEVEIECHRKSTKSQIEQWIKDNGKPLGVDWRAGYTVKFKRSTAVYTWRNIKDNKLVKVSKK